MKTASRAETDALLNCTLNAIKSHVISAPRFSIVTYATSDIHEYAAYSLSLNAAYSEAHAYSFHILSPQTGAEYEPGDQRWNKVRILLEALEGVDNSARADYVLWLDADLVVLDPSLDLESLIAQAPAADILICADPEPAEIFSLVNTGAVLVRNTLWSRRFLRKWWGESASRLASWDQHIFTRLYLGQNREEGSGEVVDEDWSAIAMQMHIHLMAPDALNTRRPATLHHHATCPALHLVGALGLHRALVFGEAWRNMCMFACVGSDLQIPLPQAGLSKERLVAIETTLLGSRQMRAEDLVNKITMMPSTALPDAITMGELRSQLHIVMRLGDPREGASADVAMVSQAMKHYYKLIKRLATSMLPYSESTVQQVDAKLMALAQETVNLAFELALPPAKGFYVRHLMSDIQPLVEHIVKQSMTLYGHANPRAVYLEFKRLQFEALSYGVDGRPADSASERHSQHQALQQAIREWESFAVSDHTAAAVERGGHDSSLLADAAQLLDKLGVLKCVDGHHDEGIHMAQRSATLLELHWGLDGTWANSPDVLRVVPPAMLADLAVTYRNMAVCSNEAGIRMKGEALSYYVKAALLRVNLLLAHRGIAGPLVDTTFDASPSSQRAKRQQTLGRQQREESEAELSELVYRIHALVEDGEHDNALADLEARLRLLRLSPKKVNRRKRQIAKTEL